MNLTKLSFGRAFDILRDIAKRDGTGDRYGMRLPHWKKDVTIHIQVPDDNSKMTAPYLYVNSRYGRVPWKETNIELFSDEWSIVMVSKTQEDMNWVKHINVPAELTEPCSPDCTKRCLNECKARTPEEILNFFFGSDTEVMQNEAEKER